MWDIDTLIKNATLSRDKVALNAYKNIKAEIPKKEMGTAIKYLKSKFPTADGKMISEIVKKYLV